LALLRGVICGSELWKINDLAAEISEFQFGVLLLNRGG